jgi:hypothetical protein
VPDATALWAYDPASDTWETGLTPMPTPREHLASAAVGGKLYVIGGRWNGVGNKATLEVYDPAKDSWESLPDMPSMRGGLTAGAIDNLIYVGGGEDPWARQGSGCTLIPSRPTTHRRRMGPVDNLPTARHGLASAVWMGAGTSWAERRNLLPGHLSRSAIGLRYTRPSARPGFKH